MRHIYLDYNATTPVDPEVFQAMMPYLRDHFGNPSSNHSFGMMTRKAVEGARTEVASLLGCQPHEIVFTSGGTESNNLAIKGVANASRNKGRHIISSSIEHPAVMEVCHFLEQEGYEISYLPVNKYGIVDPAAIEAHLRPDTILISIMHANNETGAIQPLGEIGRIARKHGILFHTDAAQSAGKIRTDVDELGVDLLSLAAHKFYGPKGIGALFIREGVMLDKLIHGADHEFNLRAGTENVSQIVGMGKACDLAARDLEKNASHLRMTRDLLFELLRSEVPGASWNADPDHCLPNTLNISLPGVDAGLLISSLEGIAVSTGSACHADQKDISYVLAALDLKEEFVMGTIRFSTGKPTTRDEIEQASQIISDKIREMQHGQKPDPVDPIRSEKVRLTRYTHGLGCACKLPAADLESILSRIKQSDAPEVLIDASSSDDAAVFRINKDTALIQTVDFFTPMVDDPFDFGAIAAANALSDIYAMGAQPAFALNIVGFPVRRLNMEVMQHILEGAGEMASQAGIPILGGHSIENQEPVFGMVVSAIAHPDTILSNAGAREGDALILTKPLGTGIITTAIKKEQVSPQIRDLAIKSMKELNREASLVLQNYPVNACTDVSGFGLLGHLLEMVKASKVSARINSGNVPVLQGTHELVLSKMIPGGTTANIDYTERHAIWEYAVNHPLKVILNDAQTSGGLLISLPKKHADKLISDLHSKGMMESALIGEIASKKSTFLSIT